MMVLSNLFNNNNNKKCHFKNDLDKVYSKIKAKN
jgi:hypothetical protein